MEVQRERIAALLATGIPVAEICEAEKLGKTLVYKVRGLVKAGEGLGRKPGSGRPANLDKKAEILEELAISPTSSCAMVAKALETSKTSVWRAVREADLKLYVPRRRQLLSKVTKASRVQSPQGRQNLVVAEAPSTHRSHLQ